MRRAALWLWVLSLLTMQAHQVMPHYHHHHDTQHHVHRPGQLQVLHGLSGNSTHETGLESGAQTASAAEVSHHQDHAGHLHAEAALQKDRRASRIPQDFQAILSCAGLSVQLPTDTLQADCLTAPEQRTADPPRRQSSRAPPLKFSPC